MKTILSLVGIFLALQTSAAARSFQQQDITGGAELIFGRPSNPPPNLETRSAAAKRSRSAVSDKVDDALSLGNSARDRRPPDLEAAEKAYRLAWKLDPSDPRPYVGLGNIYMDRRNYTEAAKAYQQAIHLGAPSGSGIRSSSNSTPVRNPVGEWRGYLAAASLANQNLQKAEKELIDAIAVEPRRAEWRAGLGFSLFAQGRFSEAAAAYKVATELQPANDEYKRLLQDAQSRAKRASVSDSAISKQFENTVWEAAPGLGGRKERCNLVSTGDVKCESEVERLPLKWKIQDGLFQLIRRSTESRICIGRIDEKEIRLKCFINDVESEQRWRKQ